ncbi:c-type cytochrome [Pseudomonas sp. NPDC086278]|uniref:c-type cytochrome n=1 Tax=Pseudomonas sp. NPDC086278 TaxID=3390646 RepID=UPI003D04B775
MMKWHVWLAVWIAFPLQAMAAEPDMSEQVPAQDKSTGPMDFIPRELTTIPAGDFGDNVRRGYELVVNTQQLKGRYVGNQLNCTDCHLSNGAKAYSAPLWAAFLAYPAFRAKDNHLDTFAERVQACFSYSMNGKAPALNSPEVVAISAYSYWMLMGGLLDKSGMTDTPVPELTDQQLQQGGNDKSFKLPGPIAQKIEAIGRRNMPGRGFATMPAAALPPAPDRGLPVYVQHCAICHGVKGEGTLMGGVPVMPALWGGDSYNWGAGMHRINTAAFFIFENMPLGKAVQLTPQQAWDVAAYINSQVRPQDPRFTGNVVSTAAAFHRGEQCFYGQTVDGVLLGNERAPAIYRAPPGQSPLR